MNAYVARRRHESSEGGAVSVLAMLLIAVAGVCAYALVGVVAPDADRYGRVGIPSSTWIDLPSSETGIGVVASGESGGASALPEDIQIKVLDPRTGESLRVDARGDATEISSGQARQQIASVNPPSSGLYRVVVSRDDSRALSQAQVSFGQSPTGAVSDRFSEAWDRMIGPIGLLLLALILLISVRPRFQRLITRRADSYG